jgi:signal transduction histidine kinase
MTALIDDLLKLSRVSRAELRRENVDLSALARGVLEELAAAHPERKVEWTVEDGLTAEGDVRLLRIALENLLGNAWKFTSRRDVAHIRFARVEAQGRPAFVVEDDGAGFDMAWASRLFGAFQRLHGTAEFEGTGVGLATVQRIVTRHGGRVWAEAEVDRGARFYFTLGTA